MCHQYPYSQKPASLKRWQPLIDHKKPEVRYITVVLPVVESIYQSLNQTLKTLPRLHSKLTSARLTNHLRQDLVNMLLPMIIK